MKYKPKECTSPQKCWKVLNIPTLKPQNKSATNDDDNNDNDYVDDDANDEH